jgi:hypothetical protein
MPEWLKSSLPLVAIACGAILLLAAQKDRLAAMFKKLRPQAKATPGLTPHERFQRLYDLRSWCETAGKTEAVQAIDSAILPAIVQGEPNP